MVFIWKPAGMVAVEEYDFTVDQEGLVAKLFDIPPMLLGSKEAD